MFFLIHFSAYNLKCIVNLLLEIMATVSSLKIQFLYPFYLAKTIEEIFDEIIARFGNRSSKGCVT